MHRTFMTLFNIETEAVRARARSTIKRGRLKVPAGPVAGAGL